MRGTAGKTRFSGPARRAYGQPEELARICAADTHLSRPRATIPRGGDAWKRGIPQHSRRRSDAAKNNGVHMAMKLLAQVWRAAPAGTGPLWRGNDWTMEPREASQWNPRSSTAPTPSLPQREARPPEPVWAETQPWCHD
jgi:hypothetical protein